MTPKLTEVFIIRESMDLYRGMTGVTRDDLQRLIKSTPGPEGLATPNTMVDTKKNPWWAKKLGVAIAYSSTPNVKNAKGEYDVIVVGDMSPEAEKYTLGGHGIVDFKKQNVNLPVKITQVAYTKTGPGSEQRLKKLLGNIG